MTAKNLPSRCLAPILKLAPLVWVLAGCGGGASGGMKAADAPAAEPSSPAAEMDEAESQINALFAQEETAAASASPAAQLPPSPMGQPQTQNSGGSLKSGDGDQVSSDPCAIACRALASMERAANHICDLSGPDDGTCERARTRVKVATDRVAARCACQ